MDCRKPYKPEEDFCFKCRKCDACRKMWKRQWLGRLMAEHASSRSAWFVTLTYGGGYENESAYQLDSQHLDSFYRSLRNLGYRFKPVAVGEYGGQFGRAHWHVILFWITHPPIVEMDKRIHWTHPGKRSVRTIWPHGYAKCEYPRSKQACVSYVLDYLEKPAEKRGKFSFGKNPAVGQRYLLEFAQRKADMGMSLFPTGKPIYQVDGNYKNRGDTAGQLYDYWLDTQSSIYRKMIDVYVERWLDKRPEQKIPYCKHIDAIVSDKNGMERQELKIDRDKVQLQVVWNKLRLKRYKGGVHKVAFYDTDDSTVSVVRHLNSGAAALVEFTHEGSIVWLGGVASQDSRNVDAPTDHNSERLLVEALRGRSIEDMRPHSLEVSRPHKGIIGQRPRIACEKHEIAWRQLGGRDRQERGREIERWAYRPLVYKPALIPPGTKLSTDLERSVRLSARLFRPKGR